MRRRLIVLLVLALAAGSLAAPAEAAKKKKKKPKPVDLTYHIVWGGEACALSTTTDAATEEESCADPFWGVWGSQLGSGPAVAPALDGLPVAFDATKPVVGHIEVQSWYLYGVGPDVLGVGQPELYVKLTGTSGDEEVVIGEMTTDPYLVTPAEPNYVVEFELEPATEAAGMTFDGMTLELEVVGNSVFHGVVPADGKSTITFGAFAS